MTLEKLLEEGRKAETSGDALRLRGLAFELDQAASARDARDPLASEARELSSALEARRKEIEAALRRRVAKPCKECGSRELLLSEPAEFESLYVLSRKVWGMRFRLVVCRGCGRTEMHAQEPAELAKDERFKSIEAEDPDNGPNSPYR
jgi:hypothetical protein